MCSYNRKYAIRLLNEFTEKANIKDAPLSKKVGRKNIFHTQGVKNFLNLLRKKTNLICFKRMKGEANTFKAIREIELTLPFKIRGFDSNNGKEFLNHRLLKYFKNRSEPVHYTRARAYNKNDNSHIEEKNWTRVRQYIGYDRIENPKQVELMNDLYRNELTELINYFLPSMKLISKTRRGSKVIKKYDEAKTPFQRLFESKQISDEKKMELLRFQNKLNPFELQENIEKKLAEILNVSVY